MISAQQILAGKPTDIFRQYVPRVEFVQSNQSFFQLSAVQVKALAYYPNLLTVSVNPELPFRNIWAYITSDYSQTVNVQDTDLVAMLDGLVVYTQKLGIVTTVAATYATLPFIASGMTGLDTAQMGSVNESIRIEPGTLGAQFYFYPIRLNITADTFYIRVNRLTDTGAARYDGRLMVRSQAGI